MGYRDADARWLVGWVIFILGCFLSGVAGGATYLQITPNNRGCLHLQTLDYGRLELTPYEYVRYHQCPEIYHSECAIPEKTR